MNFQTSEVAYIAGTPYVGATVDMYAGPGGYRGEFMAWDPVKRTKVWSIKENFPVWSGALVTAGDVVFYGTMDRWFKAVDAKTGNELWKFHADSGARRTAPIQLANRIAKTMASSTSSFAFSISPNASGESKKPEEFVFGASGPLPVDLAKHDIQRADDRRYVC